MRRWSRRLTLLFLAILILMPLNYVVFGLWWCVVYALLLVAAFVAAYFSSF